MTLLESGNFGIGTTGPATKLHVSSGIVTIDGSSAGLRISSGPTTGGLISGILRGSASLNFAAITPAAAAAHEDLTIAVTGAGDGDECSVGVPTALASTAGLTFTCFVSADNTVTVRAACNAGETTAVADACANPDAATVRVLVFKN